MQETVQEPLDWTEAALNEVNDQLDGDLGSLGVGRVELVKKVAWWTRSMGETIVIAEYVRWAASELFGQLTWANSWDE